MVFLYFTDIYYLIKHFLLYPSVDVQPLLLVQLDLSRLLHMEINTYTHRHFLFYILAIAHYSFNLNHECLCLCFRYIFLKNLILTTESY